LNDKLENGTQIHGIMQTIPKFIDNFSERKFMKSKPSTSTYTTVKKYTVKILDSNFTDQFQVIAGPCSIESQDQFFKIAEELKAMGVNLLRGGLYKLRTRPDTFQGHGQVAYPWAVEVKKHLNMGFVSEITDPRQIDELSDVVDCYQVGARNMYNYDLLKELGRQKLPVLLKRAFSATIDEWLYACEYLEKGGNTSVILCERGIRTFETKTRNTLDVNAIAYAKQFCKFPILSDPSHGTGRADLVEQAALASIAAGADGLLIEVHNDPTQALSDKDQALDLAQFKIVFEKSKKLYTFLKEQNSPQT
jgi:3-deoxy-7-phosphoheptulonate synthase